jgi:hypothetical protein
LDHAEAAGKHPGARAVGEHWSAEEVAAIVADYCIMLRMELAGEA